MMECNKDEAIRAKEIAERKMQNKDYFGARKVALKAQQLYPNLENISQLILVCDVHLSAEGNGSEKDWYGILKIESTADEASIKKQYRKLALLLHPDKNKFAGASDAFKLIGEAHRVLLDPVKRLLHNKNAKHKVSRTECVPSKQQININSNASRQAQSSFVGKTTASFTSFAAQQQQQQRQQQKPTEVTFWTMCPFCTVKYQYYRNVINKNFLCQRCKKSFTGYEIKPSHGAVKPPNGGKVESQRNGSMEPKKRESFAKTGTSEVGGGSNAEPKFSAKVGGVKRKEQTNKSSERCDSDIRRKGGKEDFVQENEDVKAKQNFESSSENLRRSTRSKTNISCNENSTDNDFGSHSKKAKSNGAFHETEGSASEKEKSICNQFEKEASSMPMEEDDMEKVKAKETEKDEDCTTAIENGGKTSGGANSGITPDSSLDVPTVPEFYVYPDPEFNDFDKEKRDDCFRVGQVWAVYDPLDAMPRFYARIRKVISSSEFKLRITWLEANPDDEDEIKWVNAELPVSCGKFETGNTEITNDRLMFSHRIDWEKGSKRDTYKIYPRKDETWALFKGWDINWYSDPETKRKYEFEFVEILSDYCEENGVSVAYLVKVKGFSCLFCRTAGGGVDSFQIPRNQLFRFSHRVPSFCLSGNERDSIPKNSFELDPASLPPNLAEVEIPKIPKVVETVEISDGSPLRKAEIKMESSSERNSNSSLESPEAYEVPEPEFFNFDGEKSPEKFHPGQFWALYSDEDGLPKYYAFIQKTVHQPKFKLHVSWLSACPMKNTISYADKHLPIGCGIFKHLKGSSSSYTDTGSFSHLLRAESTDKKDVFAIYPRKAEVWALYKNWSSGMTCSDLENCEYDIVEVLEENDFAFKVMMLEMVCQHNSVFKSWTNNGSPVTTQIVRSELLRFSHQIPAFRLTDERGGSLRGYWELDPAALPTEMFRLG